MEARYWLGLGLLALCLGTGFSDISSNSAFAIIAVLTLAVSLLLPQRWLWIAQAFWGGVLATFGMFVWATGAPDLKFAAILLIGAAAGLIYCALKSVREADLLARLNVWVPRSQRTFRGVCLGACHNAAQGWNHSMAWTRAALEMERGQLNRMLGRHPFNPQHKSAAS